ncbi:MAG: ATP-binding protein [Oscillospiraceae bacterium]|nr:ATP-binding protein [Oscillospiraceae bacterium]
MHTRNKRLIDAKIMQYLFPGIMMAMALQLGNIVDTILVGNLLGTDAMSAVSLAVPIETLIQIPGYCLGTGGAIAAGILLGKRERENASELFSLTFLITLIVGIAFAAASFFTAEPIARVLASGGNLMPLTKDYIFVSMLGAPVIGTGLLMVSFLGVENHPELASAYLIVSNVINLIFDFIFLKFTQLGTAGASLSTVLGFLLGMAVLILYVRSPKRMIGFTKVKSLSPFKTAIVTGAPVFIFMIMTFIKTLGLNVIIINLTGEDGMTIYTVCENVLMIVEMLTAGIIGVIPNMAGILYGEKDYYGIRALCKKTLTYSIITAAMAFILIMIFTKWVAAMFGIDDSSLLGETAAALRLFILCLPAYVWNKFLISYYESIEESKQASIITFVENGCYLLPAALIGILIGLKAGGTGMNGLALGFVISELLTAFTAYVYRKKKHKGSDFYLLPAENPGKCLDFTIKAQMDETPLVPKEIREFCKNNGIGADKANLAAVAAEEMTVNCIKYGGKSSAWIDVSLLIEDDKLQLRIRDNGAPFNPTEYDSDSDGFDIHGIELVKKISSRINYIRAIDLNNTVIEFDI